MTPRRTLLPFLAVAAAALSLAAAAHARGGSGILVGVADDRLKWQSKSWATVAVLRDLGVDAVRITVGWEPERGGPSRYDRDGIRRTVTAASGMRVVLSVFGRAADAPRTAEARQDYCGYVAGLLRRFPTVNDVVIWNEVNSASFWKPQLGAPQDYGALLAECWDTLHAVRPSVNLLDSTASRGGPSGTAPAAFRRAVGSWYRASGRSRPLFDTVGHHPYPDHAAEPATTRHKSSATIGIADLDRLTGSLKDAFAGTAQPIPGKSGVTVWYMEDGYQSGIPSDRRSVYSGRETDARAGAADQGTLLAGALKLAACQSVVGAFFNFMLVDEESLGGWQSGLFYADGNVKPAYGTFRTAVGDVRSGAHRCA